ncbi:hypothetical protein D3C80_779160 [compost metagenome]
MAEAVVDPLEVVDVHQQQADRAVVVGGETFIKIADECRTVAQVGQVVGVGQTLNALLSQLTLGDVFVDADVMGQFAVVTVDLGNRQLAPVGFEVLAAALELALPAVAHGQARRRVEQQLVEVFQGRQLRQSMAMDLVSAVLGDGREAWIDVLDHAVAVNQQKGVGALLYCTLEQVQGAGGSAAIVVVDDLSELIGQLAGKGDFVRLPSPCRAGLLQAQYADYLAIDADTGIEHGVDIARTKAFGHFPSAWVVAGIVGVDSAAGVQGIEVVGKAAGVDGVGQAVFLGVAVVGGNRLQALSFQVPNARTVDLVDLTSTAGDQLGGLKQRVAGVVAMAGQVQDQLLLGAYPLQVFELFLLGLLIELQGDLQAIVAGFQVGGTEVRAITGLGVNHHQVTAQQLTVVLLVGLAQFQQVQRSLCGVQGVTHQIMRTLPQLQLDGVMQFVTSLGLHQAGVGRADQCAELDCSQAELTFAGGVEVQQGPAGFIQPFETQHAEPRGHGQLRHDLGHHTAGGIGLAFHGELASRRLFAKIAQSATRRFGKVA